MNSLHQIPGRTKKLPPLRVGIGGPVGSGKTTLLELLCKAMRARYDLVAAAFNAAVRKAEEVSGEKMGKITAGMPGLPGGMKMPF